LSNAIDYLKDRRIITLIVIVALLAMLDAYYGVHLGIEFVGGEEIPVTLEHPVNITTMSTLISALQQRVSTFGMKEVTVEGIGNSNIYVIVPKISGSEVNTTINIIASQGKFDGIVNGKEAINGSDILRGSIGTLPPQVLNNTVGWTVTFFITQNAATHFAKVVFGQGNKPLYMFLDRPTSAILLVNDSYIGNSSLGISPSEALSMMQSTLLWGNRTIPVYSFTSSNSSIEGAESFLKANANKYRTALISADANSAIIQLAKQLNYTVKLESRANMTPTYTLINSTQKIIETWPAVGLLSAPVLNPSITNGTISQSYEISGVAPAGLNNAQKLTYATQQAKSIASILSGGALPVSIIPGIPESIPPTLGTHFLYISAIAGLAAVLFVSMFITIRYKKLFLVLPILLTTFMELFIIFSIIGLVGTIDLAAVAGMIAVVGTGVDAQIIITDEVLMKRGDFSTKKVMNNAFYIVWVDALLLVVAMLPLFFATSMVDVIGFSESTIIGALLGVLITRPAYGAIISRHYGTS
jgi:preprotein translocase subunit SecD